MSTPGANALRQKVDLVLDEQGRADVIPPAIALEVRRRFPNECDAVGNEAVDQFITRMVQRRLKPSGDAPRLPGFEVPARIPVATAEGGPVWRLTVRCTRDDLLAYNEMLVDGWQADRTAQRVFEAEMRRIIDLLDSHGVACLEDLP